MDRMHIKEFLNQFSVDELARRGILRGRTRILTGQSVFPLIDLMTTNDVTRLEAGERNWFLTADGEFQNPLSTETKSGTVEILGNPGNVFNEQNTSINPHYERRGIPESGPDGDTEELGFGLERDLQKALRANIEQLEPGLRITDGGVERTVQAGRIDITAEDSDGNPVIIELKAGRAELDSIGQLLAYIGSVEVDSSRPVRGILVANEFDHRLVVAAKAVPSISLKSYSIQFSFCELQ